jgi:uncharacterized OB-fold protein
MSLESIATAQIPLVSYLELDPPHLVAYQCTTCAARFFDRRNACASCSGLGFTRVNVPTTGTVRTFSIVSVSVPGVEVPFVAAIVDCGGTSVRGVLTDVPADPEHVHTGMTVKLVTRSHGVDDAGVEAISFAFAPQTERDGR